MATVYFDLPNVTNGTGTSASPKNQTGWNAYSPAAGDILLFKRGTTSAANAFTLTAGTSGNRIKWGAWFNADGSDDNSQPLPVITTTTVLSTYISTNKDYTWLDSVKIVSSGITVANDKSLIFMGTGSTISNCYIDTNISAVGAWGKSNITIASTTMLGVSHSSANNNCVLIVSDTPAMDNININHCTIKHYGGGGTASHAVRLECTDATNTLTNLLFQHNYITTSTAALCANLYSIGLRLGRCPTANIDYNDIRYFLEGIFFIGTTGTANVFIRYNTCRYHSHFGIHLASDCIGCYIDGNDCSYNGTSTNNGLSLFAYGRGIEFSSAAGQARCGGHIVRFNICNNNYNYGGPLDNGSEGVGIGLDDGTNSCLVYGNSCSNNEGNGIQCYGGLTGTGTPAISDTGDHKIIANFLSNNCTAAITNRQTGGTDTNLFNAHIALSNIFGTTSYIAHNVCVGTTKVSISINTSCDDLILANNILTTAYGIAMDSTYSASIGVCNSNDFFGVTTNYTLRTANGSGSATFAVNAYVGTNNLALDPKWTGDYHLSAGSTAISAGFAIGTRLDAAGRTYNPNPSLGMYEYFALPTNSNTIGGNLRKRIYHRH